MIALHAKGLEAISVPLGTSWLLASCMEARGKQELWVRQRPEVLAALREQAIIQSVESSNRIEGVTVPEQRLRPLVLGTSKPRDRSEEELAGYRKALDWIFSRKRPVAVTPEVAQHLHAMAQGGVGDAGRWKRFENEIVETTQSGERRTRFVPTPAREVPEAMHALCQGWREVSEDASIPPLVAVATFVLDFLCIHPFRDGNGRVSRLLTTLLLQQQGFIVGRFVSLERLVEETKDRYYLVLEESSQGWHEGRADLIPWWNYFLSVVRRAYEEFGERVESTRARAPKSGLIRAVILAQVGPFSLGEVAAQFPATSVQLVKKVLKQMKDAGEVRLFGRGRGASWEVVRGKG